MQKCCLITFQALNQQPQIFGCYTSNATSKLLYDHPTIYMWNLNEFSKIPDLFYIRLVPPLLLSRPKSHGQSGEEISLRKRKFWKPWKGIIWFQSFFPSRSVTSGNNLFVSNIVFRKSIVLLSFKLYLFIARILNKLTPEKFDLLKGQLIEAGITTADILKVCLFLFSLFCCLWRYHFLVIDLFSPVNSGCYYSHIWEGCIWAHILSDVCSAVLWTQWKPPIIPSWRAWW